jgi:hypothetical protein
MTANQGAILTTLAQWYSPVEILKMATAVNGELLAMYGPRNPYPGKLGVVEEGALADLILVDGDPIENLKIIADPEKNFVMILMEASFQGRSSSLRLSTHDSSRSRSARNVICPASNERTAASISFRSIWSDGMKKPPLRVVFANRDNVFGEPLRTVITFPVTSSVITVRLFAGL